VNGGGTYVGTLANGTTAARNAGSTMLNTVAATKFSPAPNTMSTRANNDHARGEWVRKIVGRLDKRGVKVLFAQL
jgi:hypothetical protein